MNTHTHCHGIKRPRTHTHKHTLTFLLLASGTPSGACENDGHARRTSHTHTHIIHVHTLNQTATHAHTPSDARTPRSEPHTRKQAHAPLTRLGFEHTWPASRRSPPTPSRPATTIGSANQPNMPCVCRTSFAAVLYTAWVTGRRAAGVSPASDTVTGNTTTEWPSGSSVSSCVATCLS